MKAWDGKERRNGFRRRSDFESLCPYHAEHNLILKDSKGKLTDMENDLKKKISFAWFSFVLLALLSISGGSLALLVKYIDHKTDAIIETVNSHIKKNDRVLERLNEQYSTLNINQRLIMYKLDVEPWDPSGKTDNKKTKKN